MIFLFTLINFVGIQSSLADDCLSRDYGHGGTVCVCNEEQCHTLPPIKPIAYSKYLKYTSNKAGLRFHKEEGQFLFDEITINNTIIVQDETYQKMLGFGGALTDATGMNILTLGKKLQEHFFRSYFSEFGIEYTLARVPIGGTDFSSRLYTYHDNIADKHLRNFSLQHEDYYYKLPMIKRALEQNKNLKLFASAWNAPEWMKHQVEIPKFIKPEYYQTWADYMIKFLDAYSLNNVSFWGITTGNEPLTGFTPVYFPFLAWTPEMQRVWISNNFGPTIRESKYSTIKIIGLDDQRSTLSWYMEKLFEKQNVKDYVDGIGVHWYADIFVSATDLTYTHEKYPEKFLLGTEACHGFIRYLMAPIELGSWARGEDYAEDIIEDINNWVTGWTDWNMALNTSGGPSYTANHVDSPIIVNSTSREFYKQPMYYALGHFSKFVPDGSLRLDVKGFSPKVSVTAFRRPDNGTVVVVLNRDDEDLNTMILDHRKGKINLRLTNHSITSIIYWS